MRYNSKVKLNHYSIVMKQLRLKKLWQPISLIKSLYYFGFHSICMPTKFCYQNRHRIFFPIRQILSVRQISPMANFMHIIFFVKDTLNKFIIMFYFISVLVLSDNSFQSFDNWFYALIFYFSTGYVVSRPYCTRVFCGLH